MSEAQTITSKSIAEGLDGWHITLSAPQPQQASAVMGEPLSTETERTEVSISDPIDSPSE
jgi:hypothetical protein